MRRTTESEPALVALPEAAHYLSVSERTIQNLLRRGVLSAVRIPGLRRVFVKQEELQSLVAETLPAKGTQPNARPS